MTPNPAVATAADSVSAAQEDNLELLLQDRAWVATQFSAIMTASGFGDRVIIGTLPDAPHGHARRVREAHPRSRALDRSGTARVRSRVRSPPDQS